LKERAAVCGNYGQNSRGIEGGFLFRCPEQKRKTERRKYSARMDRISPGTIGRTGEAER
jgi:hypothetical protein